MLIVSAFPSTPMLQPSDVFEQPQNAGPRKIEFHISVPEVAAILEGAGTSQGMESASEGRGKGFTCPVSP